MQRQTTVDINVFKGLISTADPKDIPYEQASDCANIDFSSIAGGIQGLQLDLLDYTATAPSPINQSMSVLQPLFPTNPTYTQDRYFFGVRKVGSALGLNQWEVWVYDQETQNVFKSSTPLYYEYLYPTSSAGSKLNAQADSYITSSVILKTGGTNIISSVGNTYNTDPGRTVPSEVLYVKHKQFQATASQSTTSDWRVGGVFAGTPINNIKGDLDLDTTAAPTAAADMADLYWLELDNIALTNSTPVADGLAPSNANSTLANSGNRLWPGGNPGDVLLEGYYYYYYTAEIMYQTESLPSRILQSAGNSYITAPNNGYDAAYVQVALYSDNTVAGTVHGISIDPRVTAINIYRVYTPGQVDDPDIYPKVFITRIPIEELQTANGAVAVGSGVARPFDPIAVAGQKQFYHVDTTASSITSPTYEDRTGIPSTLDKHLLYYGLSTDANSYHFVARPQVIAGLSSLSDQKEAIENPATIVLRSQRNSPRLFDWSTDFLSLPFAVNGMASYNGKLFVFGTKNMAIVDPETLGIDDVFNDIGILHNDMQLVIKTGLYWCDARSVYRFDGAQIERIGYPIEHDELSGSYQGWQTASELFDPTTNVRSSGGADWSNYFGGHMMYDGEHNAVIVHISTFFENTPPGYREWIFFIDSKDWCRVTAFDSSRQYLEATKRTSSSGTWILDSDIGVSANGAIYQVGAGSGRTGFVWTSKDLGFSNESFGNRKATYRYQVHGTGTITLGVSEDNAAYANVALSAGGTPEIKEGNRSGGGTTYFFRQMKMKLTGAAGAIITAVSIRLRGLER